MVTPWTLPIANDPRWNTDGSTAGAARDSYGYIDQGYNFWNDITGVDAANRFAHNEAFYNRQFSTAEREAAQIFSSAEAQKSRDWQLMYDATAYQRRMKDLEAAGVNPMAMFMSGNVNPGTSSGSTAPTSSGGSASAASSSGNGATAVGGLIKGITSLISAIAKAAA